METFNTEKAIDKTARQNEHIINMLDIATNIVAESNK